MKPTYAEMCAAGCREQVSHTPGPWIVDGSPSYIKVWSDEPGRSREICTVTPRGEWCHGESECNAKLIAASPCLKSALERLLACSEPTGQDTETDRAMEQARKALAKAQGKP